MTTKYKQYIYKNGEWMLLGGSEGASVPSGVTGVVTGSSNGTLAVTTNGTTTQVPVYGLNDAAYRAVDTSIAAGSTSTNVPTTAAVATYVSGAWKQNTKTSEGYVAAGGANANKVWKTDGSGNPGWKDDEDTHHIAYLRAGASGGTSNAATTTSQDTYLLLIENGANRSGVKLVPGTNMTISSDANGNVTFNSSYTNTWKANSSTQEGYVAVAGAALAGRVWKVDSDGEPRWLADTDTHHQAKNITTNANNSATQTTSALTNGNVYLNLIENGSVRSSQKISGDGTTTVGTDASGNIVITSHDTYVGTVSSIAIGDGLRNGTSGADATTAITSSGVLKANLRSYTKLNQDSTAATEATNKVYPVALDKSGYLSVNIPWENTTYTFATGDTNGTFKVNGTEVSIKGLGSNAFSSTSYIPAAQKGAANGVAPLNASTKIDATYLPSYVDDVIEVYTRSGATELSSAWFSETSGGSALTPETGKIYVVVDTSTYKNNIYRWTGSTYVNVSADTNTTYTFANGATSGTFTVTSSATPSTPQTITVGDTWKANSSSSEGYVAQTSTALKGKVWKVDTDGQPRWLDDGDSRITFGSNENQYLSNKGTWVTIPEGTAYTGDKGIVVNNAVIKPNLSSETSLGTLGTTSKLYAVGIDANNKLCVSVPWEANTHYTADIYATSSSGTDNVTTATNDPYLLLRENSTNRNRIQFKAGTNMTISANNKVITFTPAAYTGTKGITISGTTVKPNLSSETSLGTLGETSKLYAVGIDANNKLCVNVPWTNHQAYLYATTDSGITNTSSATSNPYLTLVENGSARSRVQLKAGNNISVSANGGIVTLTATDTTYGAEKGIVLESGKFRANLSSYTSAGTLGETSKLYAVGLDSSGRLCVNVPWTDSHYTAYLRAGTSGGTNNATTATANPYLNLVENGSNRSDVQLKAGSNVSISAANGIVTFTATDTTYGAEKGVVLSSGKFKANLSSETSLGTLGTTSKLYAVGIDANGKLCVNVPWTDSNTDTNVTQTATTTSAAYEVLFSGTADNTTRTEGARKNSNLTFNPSTGKLSTTEIGVSGDFSVNGSAMFNGETYIDSAELGSAIFNGAAQFNNNVYGLPTVSVSRVTTGTAFSIPNVTGVGTLPSLTITSTACDDITAWSAGSVPSLTITSTACDDITSWSAGTAATASYSGGILTISDGTAPSLSYTARTVGSASNWSAGSAPSLSYTARTVGSASNWSAGSLPTTGTAFSVPNVTGVTAVTVATNS